MAEAVLRFVLDQLSIFLHEERGLLGGLSQEVEHIRDELGHMRAFLRVAETKEEDADPRLQEWINQVREAAYDTEDVLDEFVARFARHRATGFFGSARRIFNSVKTLRARRRVAQQIQSIKASVKNISEGHQRYQSEFGTTAKASGSRAAVNNGTWRYSRDDALFVEEDKLVGIEQPKRHLISQLLEGGDHQLKVVSVVGMGGLGKTTLVKKVHEDLEVRRHFPVRAWVTVSQTCDFQEILKNFIRQLHRNLKKPVPQLIEPITTTELKEFVRDLLQEAGRYAIVFDDVWDVEFWNEIRFALPENGSGNRVMITTRKADVASSSCTESKVYVFKMAALSFEDSWNLFCSKTFKGNGCPAHLMGVAKGILGKCAGLPIAILAISGVLAMKDLDIIEDWETVRRSLGGELEGSGMLDRVRKILSLSYNDLPGHLKACFLYLSICPEDFEINCFRLVHIWIAERFVEWRDGMTLEDVGWGYLKELANRSLIQVTKSFYEGTPYHCRIHDLVREVILSKSRGQNMVSVATGQHMRWANAKVRRLVVHSSSSNNTQHHQESRQYYWFDHLRSFVSLQSQQNPLVSKTLLPMEILKLQKLQHLRVNRRVYFSANQYEYHGFTAPSKMGRLLALQKLTTIDASSGFIIFKEIGKLTRLTELGISNLRREDGNRLCSSLATLTSLRELVIASIRKNDDGYEVMDLNHDHDNHQHSLSSSMSSSFLQSLRMLILSGRLEKMPQWIPHLYSLVRIDLRWSSLRDKEDPLEYLQLLPNLSSIYFLGSYQGEGLCFKAGGFQKLKNLTLRELEKLRWMRVEEGALPHLQNLTLETLPLLEELPSGIQHLSHLQMLYLYGLSSPLMEKLENLNEESEDYRRIAHIFEVIVDLWTSEGWRRRRL